MLYLFNGRVYSTAQMVTFCAAFGIDRTEAEIDEAPPVKRDGVTIQFAGVNTHTLEARRLTAQEEEDYFGNREALTQHLGGRTVDWYIDKLLEVADILRPFHLAEDFDEDVGERATSALEVINDSRTPLWP